MVRRTSGVTKQPQYCGFNLDGLRLGDVILSTNPQSVVSTTIRIFSGRRGHPARFSHAAIYVGDGHIVEADGGGVHVSSLRLWLVAKPRSITVVRPLSKAHPSVLRKIVHEAYKQCFSAYDTKGAIGTAVQLGKGNVLSTEGKFFCSQLVAHVYATVNIHFIEKAPNRVTPEDILRSKGVSELSPAVYLKKLPSHFAQALIDNSTSWDLFNKQEVTYGKTVRELERRNPQSAQEVMDLLDDVGFADLTEEHRRLAVLIPESEERLRTAVLDGAISMEDVQCYRREMRMQLVRMREYRRWRKPTLIGDPRIPPPITTHFRTRAVITDKIILPEMLKTLRVLRTFLSERANI